MAYTVINFKTKKELKSQVEMYMAFTQDRFTSAEKERSAAVRCFQPGLGPDLSNYTGKITLEGPHYPKAHTWYATAELVNGIVVKVK